MRSGRGRWTSCSAWPSPQRLLPAALRAAFVPGRFAGLFGRSKADAASGGDPGLLARLMQGVLLLQRHPVLSSVLAGVLPWVRRRGRMGRLAMWVPLGAVVAAAAWAVVAKRRAGRPPD